MSSRASFITRDRSPLTKLKLGKNLSLRVHESNGVGGGCAEIYEMLNGKSHQRSLSCVYPEGKKTANLLNPFGTLNGGSSTKNRNNHQSQNHPDKMNGKYEEDQNNPLPENNDYAEDNNLNGVCYEVYSSNADFDPQPDPDQTPTGMPDPPFLEQDVEFAIGNGHSDSFGLLEDVTMCLSSYHQTVFGDVSRTQEDQSPPRSEPEEEQCEDVFEEGNGSCPEETQPPSQRMEISEGEEQDHPEYSPVYPIFTTQQEYGTEDIHTPSQYNYNFSQSPLGSTKSSVHSNGN